MGIQSVLLTVLGGAGVGLGVTAGTGDGSWTGEMTVAALAYLPAVLLGVPDWATDLSPFTHTPGLPVQEAQPGLLLAMSVIAAVLVAVGLAGFRRRDIASG